MITVDHDHDPVDDTGGSTAEDTDTTAAEAAEAQPEVETDDADQTDTAPNGASDERPKRSTRTEHDRELARAMFAQLVDESISEPARNRVRDQLVEMHLPLVEYLARRFAGRSEPQPAYRTVEPLPLDNTWVATSPRVPGYYGQAGDFYYRSYYDTPSLKIFSRLPYACGFVGLC